MSKLLYNNSITNNNGNNMILPTVYTYIYIITVISYYSQVYNGNTTTVVGII